MTIFNLGSLNIDRVFRVPRIVAPGETIASTSLAELAGGKGANQSVALARAGAQVVHIGSVGPDGHWLVELLAAEGIDTRWIGRGDTPTGQAIIQVDAQGQNAIVLDGGANRQLTDEQIDTALATAQAGDWLLAQNETSGVSHAIERARQLGLRVALNPAPLDEAIRTAKWQSVDLLCANEVEAAALGGQGEPRKSILELARQAPRSEIVVTLGAAGAMARGPRGEAQIEAARVAVVDTTAAGDTFLGYYLAGHTRDLGIHECLALATEAAGLCVTRVGAIASIPRRAELSREMRAWLAPD